MRKLINFKIIISLFVLGIILLLSLKYPKIKKKHKKQFSNYLVRLLEILDIKEKENIKIKLAIEERIQLDKENVPILEKIIEINLKSRIKSNKYHIQIGEKKIRHIQGLIKQFSQLKKKEQDIKAIKKKVQAYKQFNQANQQYIKSTQQWIETHKQRIKANEGLLDFINNNDGNKDALINVIEQFKKSLQQGIESIEQYIQATKQSSQALNKKIQAQKQMIKVKQKEIKNLLEEVKKVEQSIKSAKKDIQNNKKTFTDLDKLKKEIKNF